MPEFAPTPRRKPTKALPSYTLEPLDEGTEGPTSAGYMLEPIEDATPPATGRERPHMPGMDAPQPRTVLDRDATPHDGTAQPATPPIPRRKPAAEPPPVPGTKPTPGQAQAATGANMPPTFALAPRQREPEPAEAAGEPGPSVGSVGGSLVQGAERTITDIPRQLAVNKQSSLRWLLDQYRAIDAGAKPEFGRSPATDARLADYLHADPQARRRMRAEVTERVRPAQQEPLYEGAEAVSETVREAFPVPEERRGKLPEKVARGFGSAAGFYLTGIGGRLLRIPALPTTATTGALVNAQTQFQDALREGASFENAVKASRIGALAGTTEALPIARAFDRFDNASGGTLRRVLADALKGGAEEGLQETFQTVTQNLTASDFVKYDPERQAFEGTGEAAGIGFSVGALFNTLASMLGARVRTGRTSSEAPQDAGPVEAPEATEAAPVATEPTAAEATTARPEDAAQAPPPAGTEPTAGQPSEASTRPPQPPEAQPVPPGEAVAPASGEGYTLEPIEGEAETTPIAAGEGIAPESVPGGTVSPTDGAGPALTPEGTAAPAQPVASQGQGVTPEPAPGATAPEGAPAATTAEPAPEGIRPDTDQAPAPGQAGPPEAAPTADEGYDLEPLDSEPAPAPPTTSPEVAVTPAGRAVAVETAVVEADDLVTSQTDDLSPNPDFPRDLQPRERTRAASQAQINDIAANLEPRLLGPSAAATDGAPIIGPDHVVESGNARALAIRKAYKQDLPTARAYRDHLQRQGHDVRGMTAPVLVRRRATELSAEDRRAFTREANERSTLAPSASEQARIDAERLPDAMLDRIESGDLNVAANRDFVRGFAENVVPQAEHGAMFTGDGALSQQGLQRVENAVFARAYDDPQLLEGLRESTETNIRGIGNALVQAAPRWAQMRRAAARGDIPAELDITPNVREATRLVSEARRKNQPVNDLIQQTDMFGARPAPATEAVLDVFFRDANRRKPRDHRKVARALNFYADQAQRTQAGPGLIDLPPVRAEDILATAVEGGQGDLLPEAAESRAPEQASADALEVRADRLAGDALTEAPAATDNAYDLEPLEGDTLPEAAAAAPGMAHVGMRADAVGGTAQAEPIRREDVLRPLMADLGVPLYQGRVKGKGVLGFYRKGIEEVRIRNTNDLETTAHEIAHLLDDRFPEIRRQWTPATPANARVREELRGVSYDKDKLYEGFAEFVRLWATQKAKAQAAAPAFHAWFEDFVARNAHGPALRRAQERMHEWFEQDAVSRARSKIGAPAREINDFLSGWWDRFRQGVPDDLHGVMRMERELTGRINPGGAYQTARLTRGKHSIIEGALTIGAPVIREDGSHAFEGRSLQDILEPVAENLDDFLLYAVGRSAKELQGQGREHLFTAAEIEGMLKLERPGFREAFDQYQEWNRKVLDFAQAKGIINPDARRAWTRTQYLPFHRVGQPGGTGEAVPGDWQGIKALTGGTDNLRDILGNMIGNASMLIDAALTNEARVQAADLAKSAGGARFMARIPSEERQVRVHQAEIERAVLDALGVRRKEELDTEQQAMLDDILAGMGGMVPLIQRGQAPGGRNVVAVLRNGKPEYWEVADPLLYRALQSLNRPAKHWLTRLLALPKRLGQTSITLTLDFMAANIQRDTLMGWIMSNHGFKPVVDSARGMASRLKEDPAYREFIANGGGFSSYLVDDDAYRRHLKRFYRGRGINPETVVATADELLLKLERMANSFEMATRLGEYRRARAAGEDPRTAAYAAREVSTDFAMRGDSATMGFLYDTIIFLKAAVNGMDRLYRGLAHDPNRKAIAAKSGAIAALSMGLYALNRGNPLYDDLEDWDKDTHWHVFVPTTDTLAAWAAGRPLPPLAERYHHIRLMKIWEVGSLGSLAERSLEAFLDGQPADLADDTLRILRNTFRFEYMPQAFAPLYELAINEVRFLDRPIETQAMKQRAPWARTGAGTSRTMQALGEAERHLPREFQASPAQVEALLRGYLNTWAMYGLTLSDALVFDDTPTLPVHEYPVIRRFYQPTPPHHTKYVTEFYELLKETTEARRTMRHMDRTYRPELAEELARSEANLTYDQLSRANQQMQSISREIRTVMTIPDLPTLQRYAGQLARDDRLYPRISRLRRSEAWRDTGDLKRALLDLWTQERNRLAKRVVQDVEQRKEPSR